MFFLLSLACSPGDTEDTDDVIRLECSEGFGMAADGMCYPLAAEDTGGPWQVVEVACVGEASAWTSAGAGGLPVEAYGVPTAELVAACSLGSAVPGVCREFDTPGAWYAVPAYVDQDGEVFVACEWFWGSIGDVSYEGFVYSPIRAVTPA